MLSILLGSLSAITWGGADFVGGLASRKASAFKTVFYAELAGLAFLLGLLMVYPEALPGAFTWLGCALAGANQK